MTILTDFSAILDAEEPKPVPIGKELVTVLSCKRGRATKKFTPSAVHGYQIGKFFDVEEVPANTIFDLFEILNRLQHDPIKLVIRGKPMVPQRKNVLRRSRGEDATFKDEAIHWVCVDVDGVGDISTDADPQAEITRIIESTPLLSGVTCVAQVSSSWGIKPGIRAHLWFWLPEPRTSSQVSEWAATLPFKADHSLYNPVQPHYTASPIFELVRDPLDGGDRVFLLRGEQDELYVPSGAAESELHYWVDKINNTEDGTARHPLINKAGYTLGGWVGAGVMGADETVDILVQACEDSGAFEDDRISQAREEIKRAVQDGARNPRKHEDWRNGMIRSKEGAIKPLPENYVRIFKNHQALSGVLGYDLRVQQPMLLKRPPWTASDGGHYPRVVGDNDDTEAAAWLNRVGVHTSAISLVANAMTAAANDNPFDLVVNWLESLPVWDRVPRLYDWLPQISGCPNSAYHRGVGAKFILALIARALDPGCKVDEMLVLVGPQGAYKSTLLSEIVSGPGAWAFSDCLGDIRKPQDYMPTLMGPWLVEVAELDGFTKKEVESVKKFLSTRRDRYRMSYARRAAEVPRRGVLAGTANTAAFLTDITGNRRFWPVDVKTIYLSKLREQRDQIFAEALHLYRGGAVWYLEGEEIEGSLEEQEKHRAHDPWEYLIREYVNSPAGMSDLEAMIEGAKDEVTAIEIITDVLRIPSERVSHTHYKRVAGILRHLGWNKYRRNLNGQREWAYKRPVLKEIR